MLRRVASLEPNSLVAAARSIGQDTNAWADEESDAPVNVLAAAAHVSDFLQ